MFDAKYVGAWDLPKGRDVVVEIESVAGETLVAQGNKKNRKPVIKLKGKEKRFVVNKTNAALIAGMYGKDTTKWIGKRLALYATTTPFGREVHDCIRVRPTVPGAAAKTDENPMPAVSTHPGSDEERMREPGEDQE